MVAKWCTVLWFLYWSWGWLVCIENNHAWIRIHSSFLLAFPVRFLIFLFWMIHHFILLSYFSFFLNGSPFFVHFLIFLFWVVHRFSFTGLLLFTLLQFPSRNNLVSAHLGKNIHLMSLTNIFGKQKNILVMFLELHRLHKECQQVTFC